MIHTIYPIWRRRNLVTKVQSLLELFNKEKKYMQITIDVPDEKLELLKELTEQSDSALAILAAINEYCESL
jgi:hypothetical protein